MCRDAALMRKSETAMLGSQVGRLSPHSPGSLWCRPKAHCTACLRSVVDTVQYSNTRLLSAPPVNDWDQRLKTQMKNNAFIVNQEDCVWRASSPIMNWSCVLKSYKAHVLCSPLCMQPFCWGRSPKSNRSLDWMTPLLIFFLRNVGSGKYIKKKKNPALHQGIRKHCMWNQLSNMPFYDETETYYDSELLPVSVSGATEQMEL